MAVAFTRLQLTGPQLGPTLVSDVSCLKQIFQEYFDFDLEDDIQYSLVKSFAVVATRTSNEFKELTMKTPITSLQKSLRKQM